MLSFHKYLNETIINSDVDELDSFINKNDITLDKEVVTTIIALIDKTLNDYNRDKNLDVNEIKKVVQKVLDTNLIKIT
jgi:hypothetical protein